MRTVFFVSKVRNVISMDNILLLLLSVSQCCSNALFQHCYGAAELVV